MHNGLNKLKKKRDIIPIKILSTWLSYNIRLEFILAAYNKKQKYPIISNTKEHANPIPKIWNNLFFWYNNGSLNKIKPKAITNKM